jgi:hypothetical protein
MVLLIVNLLLSTIGFACICGMAISKDLQKKYNFALSALGANAIMGIIELLLK